MSDASPVRIVARRNNIIRSVLGSITPLHLLLLLTLFWAYPASFFFPCRSHLAIPSY
jgi:hypothetical protein